MPDLVTVSVADGIARLTVNRPEKLNALNAGVLAGLESALARVESDGSVRGAVLTGAGEKGFVAGADIGELSALDAAGAAAAAHRGQALFSRVAALRKPIVAAVNGFAFGGGCELAIACHLRTASEAAKFGQPEVKLGIIPGYGGTQRLARLVGVGRALDLVLRGEPIGAAEAERIGLVNRVFPAAELLPKTEAYLREILARGPLAVAYGLEAVLRGSEVSLDEGLRLEAALFGLCFATEDAREGLKAFLEKRAPAFRGR
ncbi:MAG: enoyl-CoA hydratase-related protein [Planctomycetales bacterium]|nr:enoyl-CoA hydratase-related protein [Planctomycetales bacterium]